MSAARHVYNCACKGRNYIDVITRACVTNSSNELQWISGRLQAVNFHVCRLTAGGRRATKAVSELLTAQWRHAATESRRQHDRPVNLIASDPIVCGVSDVIDGRVKPLKSRRLVEMTAANSVVSWLALAPRATLTDRDVIVACPA